MVYLHVPFCRSFCVYCDFYSEIACRGRDGGLVEAWADGVLAEIDSRAEEIAATLDLNTLYIGGGTPSVLPLSVLERLLRALEPITGAGPLSGARYAEFTVEVNPDDITERGADYVSGLKGLGVTRISMGMQSLDDGILRWMNRRHSSDGARRAFRLLRSAAPSADVSVDLISGVPGMSADMLSRSLEEVISWRPEHISAYQLSIEEGSGLARRISSGEIWELDEEECRAQYELLCSRLREAGYVHYEISNWALPGHEALHNSAYWTRHPYAGLGPGAHSLIGNRRSWNSRSLSGWTSEGEDLSPGEIHEEEVMLLARTSRGPIPEADWFIADELIAQML